MQYTYTNIHTQTYTIHTQTCTIQQQAVDIARKRLVHSADCDTDMAAEVCVCFYLILWDIVTWCKWRMCTNSNQCRICTFKFTRIHM